MKRLNGWICWVTGLWRMVRLGANVDVHDWEDAEVHHGCTVEIRRCMNCGKPAIRWRGGKQ